MSAAVAGQAEVFPELRARRLRAFLRFFRDPKAAIAGFVLAVFVVLAVIGPTIAPYGENEQNLRNQLAEPSREHPMGTDLHGRDVLSRIMYGARTSVSVGFIAVGIGALVGLPIGIIAGYFGGWIDEVLMRFVDAWIAFPGLILILGIVAILGPGVLNVMVAIGLSSFPVYARLIRGQELSIKERDFVLAARASGASPLRIVTRHILPNAIQPVIVQASLLVGQAVLAEAGLSFLGIGVDPPTATWGVIIAEGFPVVRRSPWPTLLPGVFIFLFVLSTSFIGDRLRDVLDPRLRGARV